MSASLPYHLQSKASILDDMLSSQDCLHFGNICLAPLQHSLHIQWVFLSYLKVLIEHKALQLEGYYKNLYSHSMAIFLVFLSDDMLTAIKHMHIGLVAHHVSSDLFSQSGILPFVESIESDLKKVRELHTQGKEVSQVHSYSDLMANYGGIMALPTEPPYCLVYPTVSDVNAVYKTNFNTVGSQSGMHTEACMCFSLLHLMDTDPANRKKFKVSQLLVSHGMQYKTLFPIIVEPHNHCGPLMDLNTREPYPMEAVGNFCLEDAFFPGWPGDSLVFHNSELTKLVELGHCIPTYGEKAVESTGSTKTHQSPCSKENLQKPPCKDEESRKPSRKTSGTSSPWVPDSTSNGKSSHKSKQSPSSKELKDKCNQKKTFTTAQRAER